MLRLLLITILTEYLTSLVIADKAFTVLLGKPVELSCESSFPPPWMWNSAKDDTTKSLAFAGTNPHPKLNEPRYSFHREGNVYFLSISEVRFTDVGKFICDGDWRITFALSLIRYVLNDIHLNRFA